MSDEFIFFKSQNLMPNDIFITDGDKERAAQSTKIKGITVYLVNISAIKGKLQIAEML